jgi:hypothetical protein
MGKVMSKPDIKITYYKNGNIYIKKYIWGGNCHREDGPAYIIHYNNGAIFFEEFLIKGILHRIDGPAHTEYDPYDGSIINNLYYINGERLTKEEWYSRLSTEQKVNLLYGKGNE